jgi:histidinol-phosphate aminotransferase
MKFIRAMLDEVEGYVPGEQPTGDVIKLNTNENPYPPSPRVLEAIRNLPERSLSRYPNAVSLPLREKAAEVYGLPGPEWIFAGNGMDEVLALMLRTFVDPSDTVIGVYPTYVLYETLTKLHGANWMYIDLTGDFQLPPELGEEKAKLCFVPRPNAPTGVCATRESVERLCETFQGLVFIDEAYVDFADSNCADFPQRFPNAVIGRTLSKSFSLAGMRLGLAIAQPEIVEGFMKTKDSYNVNAATQAAGLAALQDLEHMLANSAKIRATRERLTKSLRELGFIVPDSQSNFVFAMRDDARDIFENLKKQKIYVRYFNERRLDNGLRISVGTDEEIDALLAALRDLVAA